jgi:hypothetical protein
MSGRSPFHACKSYTQHNSWHRYVGKSFGYPGHHPQRRCIPVASGLYRPQDTLLFGKPLRALSTNVCLERADRPRITNLGTVTMTKIGQPACLSPKLANRQEHGEASETERVSVVNASLVYLRRLKIQSGPVGNHMGPSDGRPRLLQLGTYYSHGFGLGNGHSKNIKMKYVFVFVGCNTPLHEVVYDDHVNTQMLARHSEIENFLR